MQGEVRLLELSLTRLSRVRLFLPFEIKRVVQCSGSYFSTWTIAGGVWVECGAILSHKIKQSQNYGMQLITSSPRLACSAVLRSRLKWVPLVQGKSSTVSVLQICY